MSTLIAVDRTLVASPGTPLGGTQGRTFYAFDALANGQAAVPYSVEAATAATAAGLAGTYKGLLPSGTCCGRDVTFVLGADGRVSWATNALNGSPASTEGGTWTQNGTQVTIALTESGGQPSPTPANLTLNLENGLLRTAAADGAKADLNGSAFYRLEGLSNTLPAAPAATDAGRSEPADGAGTPTVTAPVAPPVSRWRTSCRSGAAGRGRPGSRNSAHAALHARPSRRSPVHSRCLQAKSRARPSSAASSLCRRTAANAGAASIQVFVTILKSRLEPQPDPMVVLLGPAGASAAETRASFVDWPARRHRDVILVDGRGAGYSTPSLACTELAQGATPVDPAGVAACFARLGQEGRDLAGYRTSEQVADVADLARTLGATPVDLYGRGEGARLAALVADRYPALVRTLVLDGPVPLAASPLEAPRVRYATLQKV